MHTLSEDKIKANQVEGDINLTATRKQWQDKFLSEKSKKLLEIKIRRNRRRKSLLSADFVISDMLLCDKTEEFQS